MNAAVPSGISAAPHGAGVVGRRLVQLRAVIALSLRIALRAKRIWIIGLVLFLPVLLPLGFLIVSAFVSKMPPPPNPMTIFRQIVSLVYLRVGIYVLALTYGISLISDEVEGKTLVHLLLRPIPRWIVVVGKFLSAWLLTGVLLVASVVLTYALYWITQRSAVERLKMFDLENLRILGLDLLVMLFALSAYLALFGWLGARLPHGERWGVVFCFGWEWLITYLPARLKWMTLMYHVQTLFPHDVSVARFFSLRGEPLSKTTCVAILLVVIGISLALMTLNLKRREIR